MRAIASQYAGQIVDGLYQFPRSAIDWLINWRGRTGANTGVAAQADGSQEGVPLYVGKNAVSMTVCHAEQAIIFVFCSPATGWS